MAIMIPSNPMFDNGGSEDIVYRALKKLPDDWFVIYSLHIKDFSKKGNEKEIDFTVFVPDKGIVVIEVKKGAVRFTETTTYYGDEVYPPYTWIYESGVKMSHNGPFKQVRDGLHDLKNYINNSSFQDFSYRLNYYSAVWFFSMSNAQIDQIKFPPDGDRQSTFSKNDLTDPYTAIINLIEHQDKTGATKRYRNEKLDKMYGNKPLNRKELGTLINKLLAPCMNIVPSKNWLIDVDKIQLNELLKEQVNILNYLEDQKTAVISGGAGTGKTMIALEKARREADKGKKVLFLCYNSLLNEHLKKEYMYKNVDFYTIDGLCKSLVTVLDLQALKEYLENSVDDFKYDVVIIDEAQDFGKERTEESGVINTLGMMMELKQGLFYLFYDKNQMVQSKKIPEYINDADCKLTLYRNCRNTTKIAKTSYSVLPKSPKLLDGFKEGVQTSIYYSDDDKIKSLNLALDSFINEGFNDITILTVKTSNSSFLYGIANDDIYNYRNRKIKFTTCRKFKGLESDAVVLIDVDKESLIEEEARLIFYVGSSRAILRLSIVAELEENDAGEVANAINRENNNIDGLPEKFALSLIMSLSEK